jgi:hypothetical protein
MDVSLVPGMEVGPAFLENRFHFRYSRRSVISIQAEQGTITEIYTACFSVSTGDVEDAPAPNALNKYEVFERDGAVYINAKEEDIKFGQRNPVVKCSVSKPEEKVVVVGG